MGGWGGGRGASDAMIERAPKKNDHPSTVDVEKLPPGGGREGWATVAVGESDRDGETPK